MTMNPRITQEDVIYFIVTDRFFGRDKRTVTPADQTRHGGTLDGILAKLDYLLQLGVTAIWVTPVYENITEFFGIEPYHYYWPRDFNRMDQRLLDGTQLPTDPVRTTFGEFIGKCHDRGMKVILDMVVNHAGYGAEKIFDPSWFNQGGSDEIKESLSGLPDFNHDNPEVRDFFIQNIRSWIMEAGVSNIRMDTAKHVEPSFWRYFTSVIRGEHEVYMIGEVLFEGKEDEPRLLPFQNYHDFDSIFDFPLCTGLRSTLVYDQSLRYWLARPRLDDDESPGVLDNDIPSVSGYRNPNSLVTLLDNHDLQQRIMSHARSRHPGDGEGLTMALRVVKLCLGALFTLRGIPQLYYGTELGLEGWKGTDDRDLRRDFPWELIGDDHQPLPEFKKEKEIYHWTRQLIGLRKQQVALQVGATVTLWSDDLVYAFLRIAAEAVVLVVINNGYEDMREPLRLLLNPQVIPRRVIQAVEGLKDWQTGLPLTVEDGYALVRTAGKSIDIYIA